MARARSKSSKVPETKEGVRRHVRRRLLDSVAHSKTLRAFTARLPCVDHQLVTRYKRRGRA